MSNHFFLIIEKCYVSRLKGNNQRRSWDLKGKKVKRIPNSKYVGEHKILLQFFFKIVLNI